MTAFTGSAAPLTQGGFSAVQQRLKVAPSSLWSLVTVETRGCGFLPDRRPQVLFERHIFHGRTHGRFDAAAPDLSNPVRGGYSGGAAEYTRLARAIALDRKAALESASWGIGQIMGFNAVTLGYADAEAMVTMFCAGEDQQLEGVGRFIATNNALAAALAAKKWASVALIYNGSAYADNDYDHRLHDHELAYATSGLPDIDVRAAQLRLMYLGFDPHGIDGTIGHGTTTALISFQRAHHLPLSARLDQATATTLKNAAGI